MDMGSLFQVFSSVRLLFRFLPIHCNCKLKSVSLKAEGFCYIFEFFLDLQRNHTRLLVISRVFQFIAVNSEALSECLASASTHGRKSDIKEHLDALLAERCRKEILNFALGNLISFISSVRNRTLTIQKLLLLGKDP